jgi:hypothetical protein
MRIAMSDQNRRRENRVNVSWQAKIGIHGMSVEPALVRNISLIGVYFETRLMLAPQSKILLSCDIQYSGSSHPFSVECEVVRFASTENPEIHGFGARFLKLGKDNLSLLLPIIAELWIQQRDQ